MGHGAKQVDYLDWKTSLLGNIAQSPRGPTPRVPPSSTSRRWPSSAELRQVVYMGDGKKHLTWDYLKALTPLALAIWYMDDGCFTVRSKGVQARTAGGTGRVEICVEAMSPGSRRASRRASDRHAIGLDCKVIGAVHASKAVLQFTTAATTQASGADRALTSTRRWTTSCCLDSAGSSRSSRSSSSPKLHPVPARVLDVRRQAADPVDAPLRHRGRGQPQLFRRRCRWCTTARRRRRVARR